jgi:PAS domain S-box-containing protein
VLENIEAHVLEAILNTLPVEVSFINENDEVAYFNKNGDRMFPRPRSIIGRRVQKCHPQKSLQKVAEILEAFKSGKKDVAEFWIILKSRQIYIRYFPVIDNTGKYLGTLEVSQDITDIKNIKGEKRLLDWS